MAPVWISIQSCISAGIIFLFVGTVRAQCPPRYTLDVMTPPDCGFLNPISGVNAVSETGELLGGYGCIGGNSGALFIWPGAFPWIELHPLLPPGMGATPRDFNSVREVVGRFQNLDGGGTPHAFLLHNEIFTELLPLPGHNFSDAYRISKSGIACGVSNNTAGADEHFGVIWVDSTPVQIELPIGPNSAALAISDSHLITGWMGVGGTIMSHAYLLDLNTAKIIDLGNPLTGTNASLGTGINTQGNVCGWSYTDCVQSVCPGRRGFFWSKGLAQDLGNLPGFPYCTPRDLNDSNVIVGSSLTATGGGREFVWQDGAMYKLDDLLIDPPQGTILTSAWSINNAGQIAANIRYPNPSNPTQHIFAGARLNPVPPLTGDLNCDWQVNVPDLLGVISAWGPCPPPPPGEPFTETCHADFNDDGVVNHHDIIAVVLNWTS